MPTNHDFCSKCRTVAPVCCASSFDDPVDGPKHYTYCWSCCDCGRLARIVEKSVTRLTGDPDADELIKACIETWRTKGDEYTVGSIDRLANFRGAAEDAGISMERAWYVFFNKHVRSVAYYVKYGEVKSNEPIGGRIMDCIVYLLLLYKMVKEKEGKDGQRPDSVSAP